MIERIGIFNKMGDKYGQRELRISRLVGVDSSNLEELSVISPDESYEIRLDEFGGTKPADLEFLLKTLSPSPPFPLQSESIPANLINPIGSGIFLEQVTGGATPSWRLSISRNVTSLKNHPDDPNVTLGQDEPPTKKAVAIDLAMIVAGIAASFWAAPMIAKITPGVRYLVSGVAAGAVIVRGLFSWCKRGDGEKK